MVINNALWMIVEKFSRLIIGVVVSAMMARRLGPVDFGELNYFISLLIIASVLSSLGLNRIIVREVANQLENRHLCDTTVITSFFMRLLASILIWLIIVAYAYLTTEGKALYAMVVFSSLLFISFDVFDCYAQGLSKFRIISLCRLSSFLISSTIKIYLIFNGGTLTKFMLMVLLEYILTAGFIYLFFVNSNLTSWKVCKDNAKLGIQLISESWPEIIAGFGAILFMRMDQICLQLILGSSSVGIYSAATRITEAWYFLPTAIISATFPKLLEVKKKSYAKFYDSVQVLTSALVMLSLVVALFFCLTADWIVNILYGAPYEESANVIILHTWGAIFLCMGISSGSWLVAEKKLKLNLLRNIFGLFVSIVSNLLLIPNYGVTGSAMATVLGLCAAYYFFDLLHPQLRHMFRLKSCAFSPLFIYRIISLQK